MFNAFFVLYRNRWSKIAVVYEKYDQNEVGGSQGCQLLMKSVIQDVSHNMTYTDGDLNLITIEYREYLTREIGTDYGSKYKMKCNDFFLFPFPKVRIVFNSKVYKNIILSECISV